MSEHGTWQGMPRENIPWYPTIDAAKCEGCRECFKFCSHGVYEWEEATNKPKIVNPFGCVVGCSNCAGKCKSGAIIFPPLTILKPYLK